MSSWIMRIQDPSGEDRTFELSQLQTIGRHPNCDIPLRDPVAPEWAGTLKLNSFHSEPVSPSLSSSAFWFECHSSEPVTLNDLPIRHALIPNHATLRVGESTLSLEPKKPRMSLPEFPRNMQAWITSSETGRDLLWTARKAASTNLSLYLAGETGTGKEVLAHLIHGWSSRKSGPFVPINCSALPLNLVESELFGHVKGAFTGAHQHRSGAFMQAHGGTLFLDEIGDLSMDIQVKLLRFLENGEIRAVGSDRPTRVDTRIVCATHRPLRKLIESGSFRQDLYYRLASVTLEIPPLRDRPSDIETLARRFAAEMKKSLSPRAIYRLKSHPWPGNVRELRHAIERACGLSGEDEVNLPESAFQFLWKDLPQDQARSETNPFNCLLSLKEMERAALLRALQLTRGNRSKAAELLGVARSTLFEMLKRHRIMGPKAQASA